MKPFQFNIAITIITILLAFTSNGVWTRSNVNKLHCEATEYRRMIDKLTYAKGMNVHCINSLMGITGLDPEEYVDNLDDVLRYFCFLCDDTCLPYVSDIVYFCLKNLLPNLRLACGYNGIYKCWATPYISNGSVASNSCYKTSGPNSHCPQECFTAISEMYNSHGCCMYNIFNTTLFGSTYIKLGLMNHTLLKSCSLDGPQACPVPDTLMEKISHVTTNVPLVLIQSSTYNSYQYFLFPFLVSAFVI